MPTLSDQFDDQVLNFWMVALRFHRCARRALQRSGITFQQWRVLQTVARLVNESGDAVSQAAVASRIEVSPCSLSAEVGRLMALGLVDVGPDAWAHSYRVLLSKKGEEVLSEGRAAVHRAAATTLDGFVVLGSPSSGREL